MYVIVSHACLISSNGEEDRLTLEVRTYTELLIVFNNEQIYNVKLGIDNN